MPTLKKIITIALNIFLTNVHAADNSFDQALDDELAYLHAENFVYSASKKMQKINDVAAAVFVLSQDDIRRSGVTTIPDALRMVPGLQVAQIDANKWAVSGRGFNDRFAPKLLVMIDGRTVYTPMFSGTYWNREDTPLEDIDRIEVIRGAGAAMWGANAVNGVINIITKSAKDTHGALLTAGGGHQETGFGSVRYGNKIGDNFDYRVYGKAFKRNNNVTSNHQNAADEWENYQVGFKAEYKLNQADIVSTQGDIYYSHSGNKGDFELPYPPFALKNQYSPMQNSGGNIQSRWTHKFSDSSETALKLYYKQDDTNWGLVAPFKMHERTIDMDFQHRFSGLEQHDIIWGLGYRYFDFKSNETVKFSFNSEKRNLQLFSAFLQDDISLFDDSLKLTLGTRLEHNDFTGFEVQPNIRLLWKPDNKQSIWGAISRAVRTPNLVSNNLKNLSLVLPSDLSLPLPGFISLTGNPSFKSETVLDYELGYRIKPIPELSFDITAFYNNYDRLQAFEALAPNVVLTSSPPHIQIPFQYNNKMKGESVGIELTSQWQPVDWLKIQASYWFVRVSLHTDTGLSINELIETTTPQQQFHLKTSLNLPHNIELDSMVRYVDNVPYYQIQNYVAVDLRLAWKPIKNLELSVAGQNLFDNIHPEYNDKVFELPQTQIRRSVFGKVNLSF